MSNATSKSTFFRQSAWMVIATVGGGVFMSAVHTVASKMEKEEYGVFFALLRSLLLVGIPAGGLQTILAQQTAGAITDAQLRQLSATVRWVFRWVFIAWLACGVVLIFVQSHILATQIGKAHV